MDSSKKLFLIFILGISSFSGLIYLLVWMSYLELFLGYSAYIQSLVLSICLGCMGVGAWLVAKTTLFIKKPLFWYVIMVGTIGLYGILFHKVYTSTTDFSFEHIISVLSTPILVSLYKWSLAIFLILPPSVLLGSAFFLLVSALIRVTKNNQGRMVSLIYLSSSLGAYSGVLACVFVLIQGYGLPGTLTMASFVNLWLAALVWGVNKRWKLDKTADEINVQAALYEKSEKNAMPNYLRLSISFATLTGMALFFYEFEWVRMLSSMLGRSIYSFELALSGFILGISIGAYWIKNRIEFLSDSVKVLGYFQVTMGAFAAFSLLAYDQVFPIISFVKQALESSNAGYIVFNFSSYMIVLVLMLPVTVCIGMSLPIITNSLINIKLRERFFGLVPPNKLLGSFASISIVVFIALSLIGLKAVIVLGAIVNLLVGLLILKNRIKGINVPAFYLPLFVSSFIVALIFFLLDSQKVSSFIYRSEPSMNHAEPLAGIDDEASSIIGSGLFSPDEISMVMTGILPLIMHDSPQYIANIGIGSGLTGHTLMGDKRIKQLDSIDINSQSPGVAELSIGTVARPSIDPRSKIHVQDAKTFFSHQNRKYDVIISDPSASWVSGVATSLSTEFYTRIDKHLSKDGVFVQRLQLYDTDLHTLASIMKALGEKFNYYNIYSSNSVDILAVASQSMDALKIDYDIFKTYDDKALLERSGLVNMNDIKFHFMASKRVLAPFFESVNVAAHSDFYPVINARAERARFLKSNVFELEGLYKTPYSMESIWPGNEPLMSEEPVAVDDSVHFRPTRKAGQAQQLFDFIFNTTSNLSFAEVSGEIYFAAHLFKSQRVCDTNFDERFIVNNLSALASAVLPYWRLKEIRRFSESISILPCIQEYEGTLQFSLLMKALAKVDYEEIAELSKQLIERYFLDANNYHNQMSVLLVSLNMFSTFMHGDFVATTDMFDKYVGMKINIKEFDGAIAMPILYQHAKLELMEHKGITFN